MAAEREDFWRVQGIWEKVEQGDCFDTLQSKEVSPIIGNEELSLSLLKLLEDRGSFESYELSLELGRDHQQVVGAIKSVQSLGEVS